jgi:hypothetical protein
MLDTQSACRGEDFSLSMLFRAAHSIPSVPIHILLVFLVSPYCIVSKLPGVTRPHAAVETSQSLATPVTGAGRRKTLRLTALGWTAR